ncbi:MAG: amidohydrolase [Actinomycetota bacterium]|nr:amidohydrolase [Actinomycetota bacterium]
MRPAFLSRFLVFAVALVLSAPAASAQAIDAARLARLKTEAATLIDARAKMIQEGVDMLFSFSELGFQEHETKRYLTGILREAGFTIQENVGGLPTGWVATWGTGRPVIALGSDIDGIPQSSQRPGVITHTPMVEGGPGHGEGHNTGMPLIVASALVLKELMQRERIAGTLKVWPGVAEELLGGKAYFVRAGVFQDVDATIFTHVASGMGTSWGTRQGTGLVSVEYTFTGETAHSAGSPWAGRSALDAVELTNTAWNFRREHLRPATRVHYIIRDGGDQPNVVPRSASVWYYLRETTYQGIKNLFDMGETIARSAAAMTGTELTSVRILGAAWPQHFNRPIAEAMQQNIDRVGMPAWDDKDQQFARTFQQAMGSRNPQGLSTRVGELQGSVPDNENRGGGSDDIGDISWVVPTVTLRYPANVGAGPGHHWSAGVASATPVAHKGALAGAKVVTLTVLDLLGTPSILAAAKTYFTDVQTRDQKYVSFLRDSDLPPTDMNADRMARYKEALRANYYDPARFRTYLEQLGIPYPPPQP